MADLEAFLDHLTSRRVVSEYTLRNYRRDCQEFLTFLAKASVQQLSLVDRPLLRRWLSELRGSGLSSHSLARKATVVRAFLRFVCQTDETGVDPFAGLRVPRAQPPEDGPLTREEVAALIAAPDETPLGLRDRALIAVAYSTGLRAAELVGLHVRQVDLDSGTIHRWDARGRERPAYLSPLAVECLRRYLTEARPRLCRSSGEGALFVARGGGPLSVRALQDALAVASRRAGVKASPADLRRGCAAHLRESGASGRAVKALLATTPEGIWPKARRKGGATKKANSK